MGVSSYPYPSTRPQTQTLAVYHESLVKRLNLTDIKLYHEREVNEMAKQKFDMYKAVTERVIEMLESGIIPWEKPWVGTGGAWSRKTGKKYCLINQFLLPSGEYATMHEINECGGKVNKGSKAKYVYSFYYKAIETDEVDEDTGENKVKLLPRAKYTKVFNIAEDTNLEVKWHKEIEPSGLEPIEELENIKNDYISRCGLNEFAEIQSDSAYYNPRLDRVVVPSKEQFERVAEFYSTVFHELGHSTGHSSRLDRFESRIVSFGDEDYSREELVAELTSCSILANTGVETSDSFRNNAAYIQNWVQALKEDTQAIVRASAKAEQAYNLIMGIEPEEEETEDVA